MFRRNSHSSSHRSFLALPAALLAAGALLIVVTQGHASAPAAVTVRVVGPAAPVRVGDLFVVTVQIEGATNLGALEFDFRSNPAVATTTAADIHLDSFLGSTGRTTGELRLASSPAAPGRPLYAAYSYGQAAGPSGTGQLVTISMRAAAPGSTNLDLGNLKITDISGVEATATSVGGAVEVQAGAHQRYLPLIRSTLQ